MELKGRFAIFTTAQERTLSLAPQPAECSPHAFTIISLRFILILSETHTCSECVRTYVCMYVCMFVGRLVGR